VPTLFSVPNPPSQLAPRRQPPKHRSTLDSTVTSAAKRSKSADVVNISSAPADNSTSNPTSNITSHHDNPRTDHAYCSKSRPICNSGDNDICSVAASFSPRKQKLRNILRRQRVQICRLRKSMKKLPMKTFDHRTGFIESQCPSQTPASLASFVKRQLRLLKPNKFGRRYSAQDREFALSLYFCSPQAYRFCERFFTLPTKRTLQLWLAKLDIKPGFNEAVIEILHKKVAAMNQDRDKCCCLVFDEMALKSGLSYDLSRDAVYGFEDFGSSASHSICNSALVFMVKGLCSKWKQPLGFFLSRNTAPAETLKRLTLCLRACCA